MRTVSSFASGTGQHIKSLVSLREQRVDKLLQHESVMLNGPEGGTC